MNLSFYIQSLLAVISVGYAMSIIFLTKWFYRLMMKKGMEKNVAIYYNRKIVHMAAGGVGALLVPYFFRIPVFPLLVGLILSFFTYIPHKTGKRFYWLQTESNKNDVKFTFMWGVSIFVLWYLLDDPFLAIIPSIFMAFGDGITGVVRNTFFKRRTKHIIGNLFMAMVCIPLGYWLASSAVVPIPWWGVIAAVISSYVERYEFGPVDDNVLISFFATVIIFIGAKVGPM